MSRLLQVKLLNAKAQLPKKGTGKSAGWDLFLPTDFEDLYDYPRQYNNAPVVEKEVITLNSLENIVIPTGIAMKFPEGVYGHIEPRSSCYFKRNLLVMGEIDEDYTGEIRLKFINLGKDPQNIYAGERLPQLILLDYQADVELKEVNDISRDSERGEGAFGSTGA